MMRRTVIAALTVAGTLVPIQLGTMQTSSDAATYIGTSVPPNPRSYVRERASRSGWRGREWRCLDALIQLESSWRLHAASKTSTARGLFQVLHQDPHMSLEAQTRIGLLYIRERHSSPCRALAFHHAHGWY